MFSPGWLWQDSTVGSFPPGIQRGNWLHAIPQVSGYPLLVLQAAALNPEVNPAMAGKAVQIECKQGAMFCESALAPNDCARMC